MTARQRWSRRRGDGGWLSLEFVGMTFFIALTLLVVIQVAAATFTMAQANGAARAAARHATLNRGTGAEAAANAAVSPSLRPVVRAVGGASGGGQTWQVTLRVPQILPRLPDWTVTRSASMPSTEPLGG